MRNSAKVDVIAQKPNCRPVRTAKTHARLDVVVLRKGHTSNPALLNGARMHQAMAETLWLLGVYISGIQRGDEMDVLP
jgi:hypothetical protein